MRVQRSLTPVLLVAFTSFAWASPSSDKAKTDKATTPDVKPGANKALQDELNEIQKELEQSKSNLGKAHDKLIEVKNSPVNQPPTGTARLAIVYKNEMSSLFVPTKYEVSVDGFNVYSQVDPGNGQKEFEFYRGSLPPGEHQITISIAMKGNGYGAFSYLKDYKFIAHAGHVFNTTDEKLTQVKILSTEKTGADPKDRPAINFQDTSWNVNVPSSGPQSGPQ